MRFVYPLVPSIMAPTASSTTPFRLVGTGSRSGLGLCRHVVTRLLGPRQGVPGRGAPAQVGHGGCQADQPDGCAARR